MVQEDEDQMSSNYNNNNNGCSIGSSSIKSSSKKSKQKKVPQRGLGVAQLEKIRIEHQNNVTKFSPPPTNSQIHVTNNNNNNDDNSRLKSVIPYTGTCPLSGPSNLISSNFPSLDNSLLRANLMPNTGNIHMNSISPLNSVSTYKNVNFPKLWQNHEPQTGPKHENVSHLRDLSLPYDETCSIAPLPNVMPKAQLNQHRQQSSTSMVMLGTKRPCPFPIDDPPIPIFGRSFTRVNTNTLTQTEESASSQNGRITTHNNMERPSSANYEPCSNRVTHEPNIKEACNFEDLHSQGSYNDALVDSRHEASSNQSNNISTKLQATQESLPTTNHNNNNNNNTCNCEVGENIDLNLHL
ncbi:hypothetical protein RND81_09G011800 [Saponaria officinalis]|uniref:Uncharacterized protein n=1 Tax=Saponaria officinalis TaxID=3572 RepID=A0AAW1IHA3_SAPOF